MEVERKSKGERGQGTGRWRGDDREGTWVVARGRPCVFFCMPLLTFYICN